MFRHWNYLRRAAGVGARALREMEGCEAEPVRKISGRLLDLLGKIRLLIGEASVVLAREGPLAGEWTAAALSQVEENRFADQAYRLRYQAEVLGVLCVEHGRVKAVEFAGKK